MKIEHQHEERLPSAVKRRIDGNRLKSSENSRAQFDSAKMKIKNRFHFVSCLSYCAVLLVFFSSFVILHGSELSHSNA